MAHIYIPQPRGDLAVGDFGERVLLGLKSLPISFSVALSPLSGGKPLVPRVKRFGKGFAPCLAVYIPLPWNNYIIPHSVENVKGFLKFFSTDQSQIFELVVDCDIPKKPQKEYGRLGITTRNHWNPVLLAGGVIEKPKIHSMYPPLSYCNHYTID